MVYAFVGEPSVGLCCRHLLVLIILFAGITGGTDRTDAAETATYDNLLGPYLSTYCLGCHNADTQEGEFRIDNLSREVGVKDTSFWAEIRERIASGEMPPKDSDQPAAELSHQIIEFIAAQIAAGESARMAQRDKVSFYRLSRDEYVNTVEDLLGVHFDATDPGGFTEDPKWHGFERIGSVLSLSASHIEKYVSAAETIVDEAYPDKPVEPIEEHREAMPESQMSPADKAHLEAAGLLDKVRWDMWPQDKHRWSKPKNRLPAPGMYEMKLKLSGLKPKDGRSPRLFIYHEKLDRVLFEQDIVAPEDAPIEVSFLTHLPAGHQEIILINDVPGPSNLPRSGRHGRKAFVSIADGRIPWQMKLTDEEGNALWPFLILDWAEWRGPIISDEVKATRAEYMPETGEEVDAIRAALGKLLTKAFRHPVTSEEVEPFVALVQQELNDGIEFRTAMKTAMLAVLCSDNFLFLVEGDEQRDGNTVTDWELASRLSYMLWSTMPDDELFALAESGQLSNTEVLRQQVQRMLADPRSRRFTDGFASQWLQLHKVGMFAPDKKLYPDYDPHLERSMIGETQAFFREVVEQNLSLREFLKSDWTMLNPRLAIHYGLPQPEQDNFVRVSLTPDAHRGGLLTQASVLSLTSDGTRQRPVHRGVWLSESIFGKSPPPPPANVDPIEPNPVDSPKATLRQKLEAHKANANCAACHAKIDPLGLAFDNYDAIGRWRTEEVVQQGTGGNPKVDPSGQLPDGRSFANAEEFKQLLLNDIDAFNQTFLEKLATYGLRRAMSFEDEDEIQTLAEQCRSTNYQVRDIIELFVMSDLFRTR